jgi:hypothetical protein
MGVGNDRADRQPSNHDSGDLTGGKDSFFGRLTGRFFLFSLMALFGLGFDSEGSGYGYGSAKNAHKLSPVINYEQDYII